MNSQEILSKVKKIPTNIYGLKWSPSLEPYFSDDDDWIGSPNLYPATHFSKLDHESLEYALGKVNNPRMIVEIGVDALPNSDGCTSTKTLLKLKSDDCMYVGIDISSKSYLDNYEKKIFTICGDSSEVQNLYSIMDLHGIEKIDFIFIDGWHSINQVVKEWSYWERMSKNAVMAFHDTNVHPGPVTLLDAINTEIFSVEHFGRDQADWGLSVVQRIN